MRNLGLFLTLLLIAVTAWVASARPADPEAGSQPVEQRAAIFEATPVPPLRSNGGESVTQRVALSPFQNPSSSAEPGLLAIRSDPSLPAMQVMIQQQGGRPSWRDLPASIRVAPGRYELTLSPVKHSQIFWMRGYSKTVEVRAGEQLPVQLSAFFGGTVSLSGAPSGTWRTVAVRGLEEIQLSRTRGYRGPMVPGATLLAPGRWRIEARDLEHRVLASASVEISAGETARIPWPNTGR